jgi:hypothetical protein
MGRLLGETASSQTFLKRLLNHGAQEGRIQIALDRPRPEGHKPVAVFAERLIPSNDRRFGV